MRCDFPERNALFSEFFYFSPIYGLFPATLTVFILSSLLCQFDPFSLPFPNNVSLELSKRSQHLKEELGERILCAVVQEGQSLLVELYGDALS